MLGYASLTLRLSVSVLCMKAFLFTATAVAFTILVSAASAQQTGTIEQAAPPPLDLPVNPAVTQATIQKTIWVDQIGAASLGRDQSN
jgi:hypothetical protein